MRARIIPFPRSAYQREKLAEGRRLAAEATARVEAAHRPELVTGDGRSNACETQLQALRIVRQVRQELIRRPVASASQPTREARLEPFLLLMTPQVETPFLVARRLVHYLFSAAETA